MSVQFHALSVTCASIVLHRSYLTGFTRKCCAGKPSIWLAKGHMRLLSLSHGDTVLQI